MAVTKEVSKGGNVIYYINEQKGTVVAKVWLQTELTSPCLTISSKE